MGLVAGAFKPVNGLRLAVLTDPGLWVPEDQAYYEYDPVWATKAQLLVAHPLAGSWATRHAVPLMHPRLFLDRFIPWLTRTEKLVVLRWNKGHRAWGFPTLDELWNLALARRHNLSVAMVLGRERAWLWTRLLSEVQQEQ